MKDVKETLMERRLVALYEEIESLLNLAPAMDDCSKAENEIYCAMSNLQNALFDAGYYKKPEVAAEAKADESSFEEEMYTFEHELEEYISSRRKEFEGLLWDDTISPRAKKPVLFKAICERVQELLNDEDMAFGELRLDIECMNHYVDVINNIILEEARKFYYGE